MPTELTRGRQPASLRNRFIRTLRRDKFPLLLSLPGMLLVLVFCYLPMYGVIIAFMNYRASVPMFENEWVGLRQFKIFFTDPFFGRIVGNTLKLGVCSLIFGFPPAVILALFLNEVRCEWMKRLTQTIAYLPYFISTVSIVGIMMNLLSIDGGMVNNLIASLGGEKVAFLVEAKWFRTLYVASGVWQGVGYGSIIYLAALAGVDVEMYEAALIDGANRFQRLWYITLPAISSTLVTMFILAVGGILGNDFTKIFLMYSPATYKTADVISTYTYRQAFVSGNLSYSTAVGLVNSLVSVVFLVTANSLAKKFSESSLW